jgi:hypothetical protein
MQQVARQLDDLATLTDAQLLRRRLCDLPGLAAGVEATPLRACVRALHRELAAVGLTRFRPRVYFGDEWFSPEGIPSIAVPFYLAHPRLARLDKTMTKERAEGGSRAWCMRLLRHEAGHCFDHAYGVSRSRLWRQIFGVAPSGRYNPDVYLPDPDSRAYVQHLPGYYAQAHPDEDFAETFAVVITPGLDWRYRYRNWPEALRKLEYVAALIKRHRDRAPRGVREEDCYKAERMRMTLRRYYQKRLADRASHYAAVNRLARRAGLPSAPQWA